MRKQFSFTAFEVLAVLLILVGLGGWVANIIKLASAVADPVTGIFILRCIGVVVAPLGAVLGFI